MILIRLPEVIALFINTLKLQNRSSKSDVMKILAPEFLANFGQTHILVCQSKAAIGQQKFRDFVNLEPEMQFMQNILPLYINENYIFVSLKFCSALLGGWWVVGF